MISTTGVRPIKLQAKNVKTGSPHRFRGESGLVSGEHVVDTSGPRDTFGGPFTGGYYGVIFRASR